MNTLVIDTNIVFSAIIKPGKVRELLFDERLSPHAPEELALELDELRAKILEHTNLTEGEIRFLWRVLLTRVITITPRGYYSAKIPDALRILADVDPSDAPFVALAMRLGAPLWTGDKGLVRLAARGGFREFKAVDTRGVEMLLRGGRGVWWRNT